MSGKLTLSFAVAIILSGLTILFAVHQNYNRSEHQVQRKQFGGPGRDFAEQSSLSAFEKAPTPNTDGERKILNVLEDIARNRNTGMIDISMEDGRLLRMLAESIGAKHVVEIGTSSGYSGLWFCIALQQTGGKLTSYQIDSSKASLARANFKRAGADGIVTLVEGNSHNEVTKIKEPIDILFLGANNEGYIDYLNKLLTLVQPGGLVIAHNISPGQADPKYVEAITTDDNLESILLHKDGAGLSVTLKKRNPAAAQQGTNQSQIYRQPDVGPVPTPQDMVEKMLEMAEVKSSDLVYDLGCGDGRIVVTAAKKYGCKAVGFDIDPNMVRESIENAKKNNVEDLVTIKQADIFTLDLSKADVITLFLLPDLNVKLIPQLEKCRPGTRIVSHEFDMKGVRPDKEIMLISNETKGPHLIFLWTAPLKKEVTKDSQ